MKRLFLKLGIWISGLVWWVLLMLTYNTALSDTPAIHRVNIPEPLVFVALVVSMASMFTLTFLWFWWGLDQKQ